MGASPFSVEVREAVKRYPVFHRRRQRLQLFCGLTRGLTFLAALDGVSLQAGPAEAVGIIGENGSGKTTLLRAVAGVAQLDAGEVRVNGPVTAILELGLGFHTDLTARENLLLYGVTAGIPAGEVRRLLPEILAFAELESYADAPLYSFSSGMTARLAFAAATAVDPNVLVVDEALAVGDGAFQRKCLQRMVSFREHGKTVLFCSHAMYQVAEFCARSLWLRQGKVAAEGPSPEVIREYEGYLRHRQGETPARELPAAAPSARLQYVSVEPPPPHRVGEKVVVRVGVARRRGGEGVHVGVSFETRDGVNLATVATAWDGLPPLRGGQLEEVILEVPSFPASGGEWDVCVYLAEEHGLAVLDRVTVPAAVRVVGRHWTPGLVALDHVWR